MEDDRLNKRVFLLSYNTRIKHNNWCFHIDKIPQSSDKNLSIGSVYNKSERKSIIESLQSVIYSQNINKSG